MICFTFSTSRVSLPWGSPGTSQEMQVHLADVARFSRFCDGMLLGRYVKSQDGAPGSASLAKVGYYPMFDGL